MNTSIPGFTADVATGTGGRDYLSFPPLRSLADLDSDERVVPQLLDKLCYAGCMLTCWGTTGFGFHPLTPEFAECEKVCEELCAVVPDPPMEPFPFDPFPVPPTPFLPQSLLGWGAAGALLLVDIAAIAWAVHDISKAWGGATQEPASAPRDCTGGFLDLPKMNAFSIPVVYPGCAGAWDRLQMLAQERCDTLLKCGGKCPDGQNCRPIAILKERVDETRWLVTCEAEGTYRCECGCYTA